MLRQVLACSALVGAVACGEPQPSDAPVTLRVGASGLSSFRSRSFAGDTAHAMELAYSLLREHATIEIIGPTRVALRARASAPGAGAFSRASAPGAGAFSRASAPGAGAFLCERLLDDEGVVARTPAGDTCTLDFASREALDAFEGYPWLLLDHGPFRWERELDSGGRVITDVTASGGDASIHTVELASRERTAIDRIVITAMPLHEAWRRLFAHQLDVIPNMSWLYRPHFADMRSVRTIDIPASSHMHLFFNTRQPAWADVELRRHVASMVEPAAVAAAACGDPACAVAAWQPAAPAAPVELPAAITIRVLSSESSAVTAAHAVSYRLRLHHKVDISVEPVSIATLVGSADDADYALVLAPMGRLASSDPALLLESLASFAGYESHAFVAAAERGDAAAMQRILEEDVPSLPLYEMRTFAAVDARFCGGAPRSATSWAWLADLRPCDEERTP